MSTGPALPGEVRVGPPPEPVPAGAVTRVVAVLVAHDGATWLPQALAALTASRRRPDVVVAVDTGSRDATPALLAEAAGPEGGHVVDLVVTASATTGLGRAIRLGLAGADRLIGRPVARGPAGGAAPAGEWLWLLHDDCAPAPDALDALLATVRSAPSVAVAGCKQLDWQAPDRLVEAGIALSASGRRVVDVATGELDQGQHDDRDDVVAVSTAGMLVRRDAWHLLRGMDPALPLLGDDIDLCLRVRRAGYRVAVVPGAVVWHVAALDRGLRAADALRSPLGRRLLGAGRRGRSLARPRRQHALHIRLVHAPLLSIPGLVCWLALTAVGQWLAALGRRRWDAAGVEPTALLAVALTWWRVVVARSRAARGMLLGPEAVRPLLLSRWHDLSEDFERWRLGRRDPLGAATGPDTLAGLESGPVDDSAVPLDEDEHSFARRLAGHPLTWLLPALALAGLARQALTRAVPLDTGVTSPLPATELLARGVTGWRDVALGTAGAADPATVVWGALTALVSVLSTGSVDGVGVEQAAVAVAVAAPPLAAALAWWPARRLSGGRAPATVLCLSWALLPWTGLAGPRTDVTTVLAHAVLPALLCCLWAVGGARPLRAAAATTLVGALVVALQPAAALAPAAAAVALIVLVLRRGGGAGRVPIVVVAALGPLLLLGPWALAALGAPRLLLAQADGPALALVPGLNPERSLLDQVATLTAAVSGGGAGGGAVGAAAVSLLGVVLVAGGLLLALAAALGGSPRPVAWLAALAAGGALLAAAVAERTAVGLSPSGLRWEPGRADLTALGVQFGAGSWSLAWLALLVVVALGTRLPRGGRRTGVARLAGVGVLLVAGTTLLAAVPVLDGRRADPPPPGLPVPAALAAASAEGTRTLLLEARSLPVSRAPTGGDVVAWRLTGGPVGPGQDSGELALDRLGRAAAGAGPTPGAERATAAVTALLAADDDASTGGDAGLDPVEQLAEELAVGWLVLDGSPASTRPVAAAIAARPGLIEVSRTATRTTWRVADEAAVPVPARARLVDQDGAVLATLPWPVDGVDLPAGEPGRRLVLAEAADPGWEARHSGSALTPVTVDGWAQGFELPTAAGRLEVTAPGSGLRPWLLPALLGLSCLLLVAWPVGRPAGGTPLTRPLPLPPPGSRVTLPPAVATALGAGAGAAVATVVVATVLAATAEPGGATGRATALAGEALSRQLRAAPGLGPVALPPADRPVAVTPAGPASEPSCPGPTATVLPEGGEPTDADPGVTEVGDEQAAAEAAEAVLDGRDVTGRAVQTTLVADGDLRGAALTSCPAADTRSWLVGGRSTPGGSPRLVLEAAGDTPAEVDVTVLTRGGSLEPTSGQDLLLAPGEQEALAVDALAPDFDPLALSVLATSGAVRATLVDTGLDGLVPEGRDETIGAGEPAPDVTIAAVRVTESDDEGRGPLVRVVVPGRDSALVRVTAVADGGPEELAVLAVEGGSVADVPLGELAAGEYRVDVSADVPVVAAARSVSAATDDAAPRDLAWTPGLPTTAAWRTPLAVTWPTAPGAGGAERQLALAAADRGGTATVSVVDAAGRELSRSEVDVPSRGVRLLPLEAEGGEAVAVVVDPAPLGDETDADGFHVALLLSVTDDAGQRLAATVVPAPPSVSDRLLVLPG